MKRRRYETEKERPLIVEHTMQLHPKHLNTLKYEFVTLARQYNILMTYEDKSETMVVRGKYHKVMDWIRHARCLLEIYQEELLQAMETERSFKATVHKRKLVSGRSHDDLVPKRSHKDVVPKRYQPSKELSMDDAKEYKMDVEDLIYEGVNGGYRCAELDAEMKDLTK
ncbi:hypothetical protein Pcinc_031944 [Petrolisthes cinctipes]|uniref:Uncharacterized protein n=1 Tax=Petrolisthes cinctipes TaxID=88211 RepID=A0AAE1EVJ6_PETCI|nr:hypothetical protein Pcinc_031944 [Petrolisthes cinctipes]